MAKCKPQDGGCWYCHTDDPPLNFSFEFDTWIHIKCIKFVRDNSSEHDPENEIFLREFAIEDKI